MKRKYLLLMGAIFPLLAFAQKIEGVLSAQKNTPVRISGFYGVKDSVLANAVTDSAGHFSISYPAGYAGAAIFQVKEGGTILLILNKEKINIRWQGLNNYDDLKISGSKENDAFTQATLLYQKRQQYLSGLNYLKPLYSADKNNTAATWVGNEIVQKEKAFDNYVTAMPNTLYTKKYLQWRKLVTSMQLSVKQEKFGNTFRPQMEQLNMADDGLLHSGLVKDFFSSYLQLQLHQPPSEMTAGLDKLSSLWINALKSNALQFGPVTEYMFKEYERYGLSKQAEYLALTILSNDKCSISSRQEFLFEQYRKMAIGNTAPDLQLSLPPTVERLRYQVIVFGSSECPECQKEIPQLKEYYKPFKEQYKAEIRFISLDTVKEKYAAFVKDLPFASTCDYKGWSGDNCRNYYVYATPTFFILDENNKILDKPNTAIAAAAWLSQAR